MLDLKSVVATTSIAFVLASAAFAQGSSTKDSSTTGSSAGSGMTSGSSSGSSSGASADPYVDCRNQVAAAKSAYKEGKIGKQEFEKEKQMARDKLKATGVRGTAEKNLECD